MTIKQISVYLENHTGRLSDLLDTLAAGGTDIRALSLADAADFGVLRLIADDPEAAERLLREKGFTAALSDVLAVEIPDRPGGMAEMLALLARAGVGVEYAYAFITRRESDAYVVLKVEDPAAAAELLEQGGVKLLQAEELYQL